MAAVEDANAAATPAQVAEWAEAGVLVWRDCVPPGELAGLATLYDDILSGRVEGVGKHRYDLGAGAARVSEAVENITQVMWPSDLCPQLRAHPLRARALQLAAALHGDPVDEWDCDFDMLIAKAPHTNTISHGHMDQAYWPELPDKRAVSVWVAIDDATLDNGCMWYGRGTHLLPLRPHRRAGADANAALECDATEAEMTPVPLAAGGAALHAGRTLHYSRGNTTSTNRRAYIMNFRPKAMIAHERAQGFDHGRAGHKSHEVRSTA